jgi:hypothetical protein
MFFRLLICCIASLVYAVEPVLITAETLAEHQATVQLRVTKNYTVEIQAPFVTITNIPDEVTRTRALGLVRWAATRLEKDYFPKPPPAIYDLWLFSDAVTYKDMVKQITGEEPGTPFGFCSHRHKAVFLNYATGGGTLVHEMTHAYMHGNFSACPSWFNEGLASLFEAVKDHDGHLYGLPNWRLTGLQNALKLGTVPEFSALFAMDSSVFYGEGSGIHYGAARYLCYALQERNLLRPFYHLFLKQHQEDPTGLKSLQTILNVTDLTEFRTRWERETLLIVPPGR